MTKSSETLHQTLSLMTAALNQLTNGIANGWVAPTLSKGLQFDLDIDDLSWIASLEDFGKIFGAIFSAFAIDVIGRRIPLASVALVFFLIWIATAFASSVEVLFAVRLIYGVFVGINEGTNAVYIAENSSPKIRGVFGAISISVYFFGLIFEFFIATYLSYRFTLLVNASVTFLVFLSTFYMKESVYFLLMKGHRAKAFETFIWLHDLRPVDPSTATEFAKLSKSISNETLSLRETLTSPINHRSLTIVVILYGLAGSVGYFPVMWFASITFTGTDLLSANEFTILYGVIQTLVVIPTSFIIGRLNRRTLLISSFAIITACHLSTSCLFYTNRHFGIASFPWLIFASITLFASTYAFVYPAIFLVRGELFPLSVKSTGSCLSIMSYAATSFLTTKIFLQITHLYGAETNFLIFAFLSLLTVLFVYFFLPETENKSLIQIRESMQGTPS